MTTTNVLIIEDRNVETLDEAVNVYNFQVDEFHTYHVGNSNVLVHNADISYEIESKTIQDVNELSNEQKKALTKYTGDDYENINNFLRGMEKLNPENQPTVEAMKSALDNSALPQDMTLYRGTSTETLGELRNLPVNELGGKHLRNKVS